MAKFRLVYLDLQPNPTKNLDCKIWIRFFGLFIFKNMDLENGYQIHKICKKQIKLKFGSNKIDFKWIGYLAKWIGLEQKQMKSRKFDILPIRDTYSTLLTYIYKYTQSLSCKLSHIRI